MKIKMLRDNGTMFVERYIIFLLSFKSELISVKNKNNFNQSSRKVLFFWNGLFRLKALLYTVFILEQNSLNKMKGI